MYQAIRRVKNFFFPSAVKFADVNSLEKGRAFIERYREIVMDPLNILINRAPNAGYIDQDGDVILHNGNSVAISGSSAYYGSFSDILIINRGVHEPLEEYCFQILLTKLKTESPRMIELGAYWSHYSMWLAKEKISAKCVMVEPDARNLEAGKRNFRKNGYEGEFIQKTVGDSGFKIDDFLDDRSIDKLEILHSDIQGFEVEMLNGARQSLEAKKIDYLFISTHSDELHDKVLSKLKAANYSIEISSGFSEHTTSSDGFIFASSPLVSRIFAGFSPLGRSELLHLSPMDLVNYLNHAGLDVENKCD